MIKTRALEGVIPVVQTPVTAEGAVDIPAIERHLAFLENVGSGGYWVLGTGGEDMNLSCEKRLEVAEFTTRINAGRLPLILGSGFFAMDDIFRFMDKTQNLVFDAYHVMPYHPLLSLDRLDWFYRNIADNAPKPVWLYYSSNWSKKITPEFVAGLKGHPNIAGIKFSSRDTIDQLKVISMAEDEFQVITAVIGQFYATLAMGAKAATSSVAGALPEPLIELYKMFAGGDKKGALEAQHKLMRFLSELPKTLKNDNFLGAAEEKYILSLRNICQPYTTSYYRDADQSECEQIVAALKKYDYYEYIK